MRQCELRHCDRDYEDACRAKNLVLVLLAHIHRPISIFLPLLLMHLSQTRIPALPFQSLICCPRLHADAMFVFGL